MTANDSHLSFGEWLRRRRGSLGLTQAELAQQLGCAPITLRKMEAEERFPSADMAARMADCLQLSVQQTPLFIRFARGELRSGSQLNTPLADHTENFTATAPGVPFLPNATLGRDDLLLDARRILTTGGERLLTLVGPPGVGKTRLTLALIHRLHSRFADGAVFVELTSVSQHEHVAKAIADALQISPDANADVETSLFAALHDKNLLLALDNFEHVLAAAPLVSALLENCPSLRCVISSRELLAVPKETHLVVEPFALPDEGSTLGELARNPSVALFVSRAAEVSPGFELVPENAQAICAICRQLDGLPLALELAAARVKLLAPNDIASRLEDSLGLLTRQHPSARTTHPTLRAALAWSDQLLSEPQRALLYALSIFSGSFTLDMAEAVAPQALKPAVIDTLEDLISQSLVAPYGLHDLARRYRLLDTVRRYAIEKLETSEDALGPKNRWLQHALQLAMTAAPHLRSSQQTAWLNRLTLDLDNLRVALRWACDAHEVMSGLQLATALEYFWDKRGSPAEGVTWLTALLALDMTSSERVDAEIYALAQHSAGVLSYRQGNLAQARNWLEASRRAWQARGDLAGTARATNNLGNVALDAGDYDLATQQYQEALSIHRLRNNTMGIASVLNNLGFVHFKHARYAEAKITYQESLGLYRQLGDLWSIASCLNNLGETSRRLGDFQNAQTQLAESFEIRRELDDKRGMALVLANQAMLAIGQNDWAQAAEYAQRSLKLILEGNHRGNLAPTVEVAAHLEASRGELRRAVRLNAFAAGLRQTLGTPLSPADEADLQERLSELRAKLGDETFSAQHEVGKAMKSDQVLADINAIAAH